MADRERAIKGLECCTAELGTNQHRDDFCAVCPYKDKDPAVWYCFHKHELMRDSLVLLKALDVTPEELERLKKCRHECKIDCLLEHYESIKAERDALLEARDQRWTPITFRALTDEEKEDHPEWCYIIDSPTPEDGEEILVSNGRCVWSDVWGNDGVECYLESGHGLEGVAWMKMPEPWKKEAADRGKQDEN